VSRFELALYAGPVVYAPGETVLLLLPEDERPLRGDAGWVDWRLCGQISRRLLVGDLTGKLGEAALLPGREPLRATRLLLLGVGPCAGLVDGSLSRILKDAATRLRELRTRSALLVLPAGIDLEHCTLPLLTGLILGLAADPGREPFRLVVPDATPRARILEAALGELLPRARRSGMTLELGWLSSRSESPVERATEVDI